MSGGKRFVSSMLPLNDSPWMIDSRALRTARRMGIRSNVSEVSSSDEPMSTPASSKVERVRQNLVVSIFHKSWPMTGTRRSTSSSKAFPRSNR